MSGNAWNVTDIAAELANHSIMSTKIVRRPRVARDLLEWATQRVTRFIVWTCQCGVNGEIAVDEARLQAGKSDHLEQLTRARRVHIAEVLMARFPAPAAPATGETLAGREAAEGYHSRADLMLRKIGMWAPGSRDVFSGVEVYWRIDRELVRLLSEAELIRYDMDANEYLLHDVRVLIHDGDPWELDGDTPTFELVIS